MEERTIIYDIANLLAQTKPQKTSAYLIVVYGKSMVGKMYKLERAQTILGRASDADIRIDDDAVSRHHAKIIFEADGTVQLVDIQSTNGTFCNGQRIELRSLQEGDRIQIGSTTVLKFSYQDVLDETAQRNLYESATRDELTGIYNKKFFLDTLRKELAHCLRHRVPVSLIMIDVDHFKLINDSYGHLAGDQILAQLAARIAEAIRTEDVFARYGGEEFVVLLRETPADKALILAERLRRTIDATDFKYNHQSIKVTISAGISTLQNAEYLDSDSFVEAADQCLYRAKQCGRNRVEA